MSTGTKNHFEWRKILNSLHGRIITQKWFDVGLRTKMSVMVTVGLIGLISIFGFIAISTVRQNTQQSLSEHVLRARILAGNIDLTLGQTSGMLTILASEINTESPQSMLDMWKGTFERDFESIQGIYLFDARSELVAAIGTPPSAIDWAKVPAMRITPQTPARAISTEGIPYPFALIAVPVPSLTGQAPAGMLAAVLDLSNYSRFLLSSSTNAGLVGTLQILDGNGKVLSSTAPDQTLTPEVVDKILTNLFVEGKPTVEACLGCLEDLGETGTVIAFAPLSEAPWGVVIWHESDILFAPVRTMAIQIMILGALTIGGALFLVLVTTRSVINPVQALTEATRTISELQFDPASLERIESSLAASLAHNDNRRDEIGMLSKSFSTMCSNLQLSIQEIRTLNSELDMQVQARTQQLSILNMVALTVNQSLNIKEILNRALDEVLQLTGIDMVAIFLQDATRNQLKLSASRGLSENAAKLAYQIGLLDGNCGGIIELGKPVVVPDLSPYRGRGAESLKKERITALMHVPLTTKGYAMGSMCVGTRANMEFDNQQQRILVAIGNQIAIAVENARLYAEVQRKERLRGDLLTKALAAQEEERKRIARELHDEISQSLTALLYEAEDGLEMDGNTSTRESLQSICDLTRHALDNIHKLIFDLRPSMLDQLGLIPAVRWLAETHLESRGLRVQVNANSDSTGKFLAAHHLSSEIETALYRVIQEAVNNIARHAAAHNVVIHLELDEETVHLDITDDGIGFDLVELNAARAELEYDEEMPSSNIRGLGLMGMQERIELLGGELEILTAPGSGTKIHIHIPWRERSLLYD